jgi:hypothetical protein
LTFRRHDKIPERNYNLEKESLILTHRSVTLIHGGLDPLGLGTVVRQSIMAEGHGVMERESGRRKGERRERERQRERGQKGKTEGREKKHKR